MRSSTRVLAPLFVLALAPAAAAEPPELGPSGYDSQGRHGRIHVVVRGDTLWDISDAYLGTPWVWPSIWQENQEIENPHLIVPGDRLWISPTEIRHITAAEAEALLAGVPAAGAQDDPFLGDQLATDDDEEQRPSGPRMRFTYGDAVGLLSEEQVEGAATLVSGLPERTWLGTKDQVFIGLREGQVEPGDQFTVLRSQERVYDPDSGEFLGFHVHVLGWIEVSKVHPEVSLAEVRMSHYEMRVGDLVLPREATPIEIELRSAPPELGGRVVFMPNSRTHEATLDVVYLDRGTEDGLDVGSTLQVVRSSGTAIEAALRGTRVDLPDLVIADLVVVSAQPGTSAAVVIHSETEVLMGDTFRGRVIE